MGILKPRKAAFWTVLATIFVVFVTTFYSVTAVSAKKDHDDPTPTPTATPAETKVVVCHKDGHSGNYSKVDVSVHSVNDANGLNGHGNHNGDIWSPFTYNTASYSGQGDYNGTNFDNCSRLATATPTASPTPTGVPTQSPTASPTPTTTNFVFPSCVNYLSQAGDKAHYTSGMHQIVGGPLLSGSDDVYTLTGGNYLQCFCPAQGNQGIQTNWLRTINAIQGWFFENGVQWNLGNYNYAAQNLDFSCDPEETPAPTPTPVATPTDDPNDMCPNLAGVQTSIPEGWYRLDGPSFECRQFQYGGPESSHVDNPGSPAIEGYGTGGQVLGTSTMAGAGSFEEMFYQAIMTVGATLSAFGIKGLKKAKKTSKK